MREVLVEFEWHPGMASSQKQKNVVAMHHAGAKQGLVPLLEVSSKSDSEMGQRLSAFSLKLKILGKETTLESAYQGSKVFEFGGPFHDLYWRDPREAKRDERLRTSGQLIGFRFEDEDYPSRPANVFYDWLYLNALFEHREWLRRLQSYAGFTDIEFNPKKSINCQARSCAVFVSLQRRGLLYDAVESIHTLSSLMQSHRHSS